MMMKHSLLYIATALLLASCGGKSNDNVKTFAPQDRTTSSLSEEERSAAINAMKSATNADLQQMLYSHDVKFSVLQPVANGDITEGIAQKMASKLLAMASANGISGMGNAPGFALGVETEQTERLATGTAPQRMTVGYDLTYKVINTTTGDVYASATQHVSGVGRSFEEATRNAVDEMKNTSAVQQMLQTASNRIVEWYDANLPTLQRQVDAAAQSGNYALALALVESVPQQATKAADYAQKRQSELFAGMKHKMASETLASMQAAIASAGEEFDPQVGGYFSLLPTDAPEYKEAQSLFAKYQQTVKAHRDALEAKAVRDEAAARAWELEQQKMAHETELMQIEADKVKSKYESQANAAALDKNQGFFKRLGNRLINGIDFVGEIFTQEE